MILDVMVCALWCVGILTLVWCLAGWLFLPLPGSQMTVVVPYRCEGAVERQIRSHIWLRAAGLERGALFLLSDGLSGEERKTAERLAQKHGDLCILSRAQFCAILMMETGHDEERRSDDTRHSTKRTVSEP